MNENDKTELYDLQSQSMALFDALIRDRIEGLPSHIMSMSINLDIANDFLPLPYMEIKRAVTDADGNIQASEDGTEVMTEVLHYILLTANGKITAKKDPK